MKQIILLLSSIFGVLTVAFSQNYTAQPFYQDGKIRIYNTTSGGTINPATVAYTLDLNQDMQNTWGQVADGSNGPNAAVIYNNKLFVSFDMNGTKGGVLVYDFATIFPTRNAVAPKVIKPGGGNGNASAGMAINPANGDLYIATFHGGSGEGGVYYSTAASNYTNANLFAGYNSSNAIDYYCANINFDSQNNIWLTTWNANAAANSMFLICFKNAVASNYYKIINTASKSYTATSLTGATKTVHLFSAPEGVVRDVNGNVWVGNNNDFNAVNGVGEGTLVKINNAWITNTLFNMTIGSSANPPATGVSVYYIPNGKLGGLAISGNNLYINDQGQSQGASYLTNGTVWKYDITTAFNSTNFKASGIRATYPGNGLMTFTTTITPPVLPTRIFVKANATGANNGTSWANAYTDLQNALNSTSIDTVFVADGIYKPNNYPTSCTNCTNTQNYCFFPHNNSKIFGGFGGTERWLNQRPTITGSNTILSGDINTVGTNTDNAYHVVLIFNADNVVIDGFTIQDGYANSENSINISGAAITSITNSSGAGIFAAGGNSINSVTIQKCRIRNNTIPNSPATSSYYYPLSGAGVYLYDYNTIIFNDNTLINNNSIQGGAVFLDSYASNYVGLNNCIFKDNTVTGSGGGMLVLSGTTTNLVFNNTIFESNIATYGGGLCLSSAGTPTIQNCVFAGNRTLLDNSTVGQGAALYVNSVYNYTILNSTFYNNVASHASSLGGAIYEGSIDDSPVTANPTIKNCIFDSNYTGNAAINGVPDQIYSTNSNPNYTTQVSNTLIRGVGTFVQMADAGNNLLGSSYYPDFINPTNVAGADGSYFTADDGLHITCVSVALNAGNNSPTLTDITNATRQGIADIGAYESPCGSPAIFQSNSSVCQSITQNTVTGNAWFHFVNASGIVCSINPQGQNLGNVTAKVADPTGVVINGVTRYLGRSVNLTSTVAPTSNYLLRLYFKDTEITEFQAATGQSGLTPQSFNVLWSSGGTGCGINNFYGTSGGIVPAQNGVTTGEFGASNEGFYLQVALNHFTLFAASTDTQNTIVGIEEEEKTTTDAIIYPNPTTNDIHIELNTVSNDHFSTQLFDIMGRKMTENTPMQNNQATIFMETMPNGIYNLVIMQADKVVLSKRVIKL